MHQEKITAKIKGLNCPGCAEDLRSVLMGYDGVLRVEVFYADDVLSIEYDSDKIKDRQILSAINAMGIKTKP
ncbi:MAG: cation transporter [Nitrospirae bacterium]|nr:cation transporter [Nitrospirota bacterium]